MLYQQKLDAEVSQVKSAIINMLSQSKHPTHQKLLSSIISSQHNEWLDTATQNLGPEYEELIIRMTKLEAAISQIEIGQYGICCDCEAEIPVRLLEQDPTTQRCEKCATRT